jgi:glycosyltransferase involved in cell wall biosynthesis
MSSNPIKVIHVIHWPKSGIVSLVRNIIALMPNDEVESHIIFLNHDKETLSEFEKACKTTHGLDFSSSFLRGLFHYFQTIRDISPDIIHAHSFQPYVWGTLFHARKAEIVSTIHNDYPYFKENKIKSIFKKTIQKKLIELNKTNVVAVSNKIYNLLSEIGIPSSSLYLIENGVPLPKHKLTDKQLDKIKQEIGKDEKNILILSLGRLDKQKGFNILLHAFQEISKRYKNIKLAILGDGPEKVNLLELTDKLGINQKVNFIGFKSNPEHYLAIADIYICSSVYEGFSLAVAEAMTFELPTVATEVGAIPDMIEHGVSGLLIEPNNSKAISDAVDVLLSGRYDFKTMGEKARKTIIERYDIGNTANSYLKLYNGILSNARNGFM